MLERFLYLYITIVILLAIASIAEQAKASDLTGEEMMCEYGAVREFGKGGEQFVSWEMIKCKVLTDFKNGMIYADCSESLKYWPQVVHKHHLNPVAKIFVTDHCWKVPE